MTTIPHDFLFSQIFAILYHLLSWPITLLLILLAKWKHRELSYSPSTCPQLDCLGAPSLCQPSCYSLKLTPPLEHQIPSVSFKDKSLALSILFPVSPFSLSLLDFSYNHSNTGKYLCSQEKICPLSSPSSS